MSNSSPQDERKIADDTLLERLVSGSEDAFVQIFNESIERLRHRIANRMPKDLRRHTDEEDVALSVMNSFIGGIRQGGRFKKLKDKSDLWQILGMLTKQKIAKHIRRHQAQKRGAGEVRGESVFPAPGDNAAFGLGGYAAAQVEVRDVLISSEEIDRLFQKLNSEVLRDIAIMKLEGYEQDEIAKELEISPRTVGRKLAMIREQWSDEISRGE